MQNILNIINVVFAVNKIDENIINSPQPNVNLPNNIVIFLNNFVLCQGNNAFRLTKRLEFNFCEIYPIATNNKPIKQGTNFALLKFKPKDSPSIAK